MTMLPMFILTCIGFLVGWVLCGAVRRYKDWPRTSERLDQKEEADTLPPVRSDPLFGSLILRVEHGWLCWRTETGWLAYSIELRTLPACGLHMGYLVAVCERNIKQDMKVEAPK
jgi:hypothetical protein